MFLKRPKERKEDREVPRTQIRDRKGTPENFCNKDFAELSDELSGAICLKALVLMGNER